MFLKILILSLVICETFCQYLFQHDQCEVDHRNGVCEMMYDCPSAMKDLKRGIRPVICGFEGKDPIVCCVIEKRQEEEKEVKEVVGRQLHQKKCKEFLDEINLKKEDWDNYGFTSVVGGIDAKPGEYPHMAVLGYGEKDNIQWKCGGSLISKTFILTAGHCLSPIAYGDVKYARLGDIELQGKNAKDFEVVQRIRHPDYKPPIVYNDIALLKINKPVEFSLDIQPACFHPDKNVDTVNSRITATGWGLTEHGGSPSNILQTVALDIFGIQVCNNSYRNSLRRIPRGILDEIQICAGGREKELDTCQGDSGGPLQMKGNNYGDLYKIIGVTSFGKGCGTINVPAIYTRVAPYIPWIESIVFS